MKTSTSPNKRNIYPKAGKHCDILLSLWPHTSQPSLAGNSSSLCGARPACGVNWRWEGLNTLTLKTLEMNLLINTKPFSFCKPHPKKGQKYVWTRILFGERACYSTHCQQGSVIPTSVQHDRSRMWNRLTTQKSLTSVDSHEDCDDNSWDLLRRFQPHDKHRNKKA